MKIKVMTRQRHTFQHKLLDEACLSRQSQFIRPYLSSRNRKQTNCRRYLQGCVQSLNSI